MSVVAFVEVTHKMPDCGEWLKDNDVALLGVDNAVLQEAIRIKDLLEIVGDAYHSKGVERTTS